MTGRTLHYNWVQCDDPQGRGGGVSVYLRNLLSHLVDHDLGASVVLLSSGRHYGIFRRRTSWRKTSNMFEYAGVRSFCIDNSPVKAPAHDMFYAIREWRTNRRIAKVFEAFLRQEGPFETIVFHSMEGISSEVLALREEFPETRFVFMWHNYMPLCPQIELLYQMRDDCVDYENGLKCAGCLGGHHNVASLVRSQRLGSSLERWGLAGRPIGNFVFGAALGVFQLGRSFRYLFLDVLRGFRTGFKGWAPKYPSRKHFPSIDQKGNGPLPRGQDASYLQRTAADYRLWREVNLRLLNGFDAHWAVSELVRETIQNLGIVPERVIVTPLAMDIHASPDAMKQAAEAKPQRERLVLSFMGYGIPSKGLPFITRALVAHGDPILKQRAELVIYARLSEHQKMKLAPLLHKFAAVRFVDGYDRSSLPRIARATDLNIVPSIWRETYNQVSYEMMCLGTPSLISSSVGFGMFYEQRGDFIFQCGNEKDFAKKLAILVRNPKRVQSFFSKPIHLPDMNTHTGLLGFSNDEEAL